MKKGLYKHDDNFYTVIGEVKSKNSKTKQWEKHVLYICIDTGEMCSIEEGEFCDNFIKHPGRQE